MNISTEIRDHYDDYYGSERLNEWRRLGAVDKAENIAELCAGQSIESVIEIGCGNGAIIARLAEIGFAKSYLGVDISQSAIALANSFKIPGARFEQFDGETVSDRYDLAILSHVVEHLEHPRTLINAAKRMAKHVVIEVPCEHTFRLQRNYRQDPTGHINFYTPKTIRLLIQSCGLSVDKQITKGSSLAVMQFENKFKGTIQHIIRQSALMIAPPVASSFFCYHTALLCHQSGDPAGK